MSKKLQIGGIGYISKAGTGGEEFDANTSGSAQDRVWYRVPGGLLHTLWEGVAGKDVHEAYLDADQRTRLDNFGDGTVKYKTQAEVEGAGASDYILWLKS